MSGYCYAIEAGDAVKIGWAGDPVRRLSELNVGSPGTHRLLGFVEATKEQEAELHRLLKRDRIRGEWFRKSYAVNHFISMLRPHTAAPALVRDLPKPPVGVPAKWAIINDLAEKEGVPKDTRRKWRIRGVPTAWQIKLVTTSPHLSFDDFQPVEQARAAG